MQAETYKTVADSTDGDKLESPAGKYITFLPATFDSAVVLSAGALAAIGLISSAI